MGLAGALAFGFAEALARNTLGQPSIMDSISRSQTAHAHERASTTTSGHGGFANNLQQQTHAGAMLANTRNEMMRNERREQRREIGRMFSKA